MENSHQYTKPFTTDGPGIPWTDALVDGPPPRQEEPMGVPNTITGPSMSPQQLDATVNASPIIMEGEASPVQGTEAPKAKPRRSRFAPEPDWSEMRRRQIKTKTHRTGQACDRCKVCQESCFLSSIPLPAPCLLPRHPQSRMPTRHLSSCASSAATLLQPAAWAATPSTPHAR